MKKHITFLLVLFLSVQVFISCSSDDSNSGDSNTLPLEETMLLNVSYGSDSQQVYDIYLPANRTSEKTKVLVLVHGGGWTGGDKADMNEFIDLIKLNHPNHAIVNINYVLAVIPSIPAFPNQFIDLESVIFQLTSLKDEYHILPEFGLIGTSAGAHISLMYDYLYDTNDQVKMVCDIVGPSNFTDPFYADDPLFELALAAFIDENAYPQQSNLAELTSPLFHVSKNSSPTILFYGSDDPLVPLSNGNSLDSALTNSAVTHSYTIYEGGHGNWSDENLNDLKEQLITFINTHLPIN
ncbi:MAG: alpha/beta hydrolase [Flavobacteriaceae bacterium]|nr:alpha/beta hydrolase [Flavobacteriaceae bacterium]